MFNSAESAVHERDTLTCYNITDNKAVFFIKKGMPQGIYRIDPITLNQPYRYTMCFAVNKSASEVDVVFHQLIPCGDDMLEAAWDYVYLKPGEAAPTNGTDDLLFAYLHVNATIELIYDAEEDGFVEIQIYGA